MNRRNLPLLSEPNARKGLISACREHGISIRLLESLIEIQREHLGRARKLGITEEFSAAIAEFIDEKKEK